MLILLQVLCYEEKVILAGKLEWGNWVAHNDETNIGVVIKMVPSNDPYEAKNSQRYGDIRNTRVEKTMRRSGIGRVIKVDRCAT